MQTIHKFPIAVTHKQTIYLNKEAEPLTVQLQNDAPCLWAKLCTHNDKEAINIVMYGTGWSIDENVGKYLGTVQLGDLVFHYFLEQR